MKQLPEIEAAYTRVADQFDSWIDEAQRDGNSSAVEGLERKQRINDAAYLLLVWGQLEIRVNELCTSAIGRRLSDAKWETRRAWDAYNPDNLRFKFEDRLALVLDRSNSVNDSYRSAIRLYQQRNLIAHGKSLASGVDVSQIIAEVYVIIGNMRD